jgi:hypothetical protein
VEVEIYVVAQDWSLSHKFVAKDYNVLAQHGYAKAEAVAASGWCAPASRDDAELHENGWKAHASQDACLHSRSPFEDVRIYEFR